LNKATALLLLLAAAMPLIAQQQSPAGETIEVSIINVDVFVTDRKGNRVHGLTRDDFEIRENGQRQPITNFAEYAPDPVPRGSSGEMTVTDATPRNSEGPEGPRNPVSAQRNIVIFVELQRQPSARVREVFGALREFVRKAVRPGDAATVVAFDTRLSTRQAFTDDTAALERALVALEKESIGAAVNPRDLMRRARENDDSAAQIMSGVTGQPKGAPASLVEFEGKAADLTALVQLRKKSAAMTSIMESMSGAEGKKIMVLALQRFGLNPGFEPSAETRQPNFALNINVERERQAVMRTANANGVTLYPLHTPGLTWGSVPDGQEQRIRHLVDDHDGDLIRAASDNAALMNHTASLVQIAQETGGLMAAGPSDIVDLLPRVVDDLESYYSLAYRATPTGKDVRRKVVVTTKNRDYIVRSRRAVVERSDDTQMNNRVVANLYQPMEHSLIPIRVDVGVVRKTSSKRRAVPVVIRVPLGALTQRTNDGVATGSFTVFVGTGAAFGVISDVERREQPYSFKVAELEQTRRADFTYNVTIEVDHLANALSVGVRDDVSKEFGLARVAIPGRSEKQQRGGTLE